MWILLAVSCMINANAHIALQMSYYNSEDDLSISLEGENLAFDSFCTLEPDSIFYDNGGSSKNTDAGYSYALSLNGETEFSSAETDSGMFGWSGHAEAGGDLGLDQLKVSSTSAVKDGMLNIAYGNNDFKVQETIEAEESGYSQKARITTNSVDSDGSGSTLQPVPGLAENLLARSTKIDATATTETDANAITLKDKTQAASTDSQTDGNSQESPSSAGDSSESTTENKNSPQGIKYFMAVEDSANNKQGSIDAQIMGSTEAQWKTQVKFDSDEYLFGVKTRGIGLAPIDELSIIGKATGFPTQKLPPGNVNIKYEDKITKYTESIEKELQDFDSEYAGKTTPALWYYLNNLFQNEAQIPSYTSTDSLAPLERYQLSMAFNVGGYPVPGNDSG
jgi:hypothetical protein